jgi:hypothetical protein
VHGLHREGLEDQEIEGAGEELGPEGIARYRHRVSTH